MSLAKVAETTALFPPQQARLRLPRVPYGLQSFPVMACREKPLANGVLSPVPSTAESGLNGGLVWYKRLQGQGRSRHPRLEPLRQTNKTPPLSEQRTPRPSGSSKLKPAGSEIQAKGFASSVNTRSKACQRSRPEDRTNSKKENSDTVRRPQDDRPSFVKSSMKKRMSYPPCTGPSHHTEMAAVSVVKETNSCPVLCDLDNLTITTKKTVSATNSTHKCPQPSSKELNRLGTSKLQKNKRESSKRHGEHDRLRVPDAKTGRARHRRARNSREETRTQRPKPPSWQDLPHEAHSSANTQEPVITHSLSYVVPESIKSIPGYRCDSATIRSTVELERRAVHVRANIKRTRSRVIDSKEIPKHETVLPLSQTKPSEFHLRKTYHDDTVYLLENAQRCRKWLAALEESEFTPLVDESETTHGLGDETVTCDLEISHDKWNFLGSPYPTSSECSSEDYCKSKD